MASIHSPAMVSAPVLPGGEGCWTRGRLRDKLGRTITDLRVSITDRCNYKCVYCRTGNQGAQFAELAVEHYVRMIRVFVGLGIEKVRLTGGEPLLRRDIVSLVEQISRLRAGLDGDPGSDRGEGSLLDVAVTTNGHRLAEMAVALKRAGLTRVTVSMDAIDATAFARITRVPGSFARVLAGVRAAKRAGLGPVKVNCVLLRGFNDDQIVPFARFSRDEGVAVRFIEFMPLEEDRLWTPELVIRFEEVVERLNRFRPMVALPHTNPSETARRFTFEDGLGEIGIIAPVSQAFCGACSRIRLTSDGKIRTCLFSHFDHDLYGLLARGGSDWDLAGFIRKTVALKEARHHIGEPPPPPLAAPSGAAFLLPACSPSPGSQPAAPAESYRFVLKIV